MAKKLIQAVKISPVNAVVGESIRVDVRTSDQAAVVSVNNVAGDHHFLQYDAAGSYTIVISATVGKTSEHVARRVKIGDFPGGDLPYPLIRSNIDLYSPRTVDFSIANPDAGVTSYEWTFGDGNTATSNGPSIGHDYSDTLERDKITSSFDVSVTAHYRNGTAARGTRTISIFSLYAYNKIRHGVLTPRVDVLMPVFLPMGGGLCGFTVHNPEDEDLSLSDERHEWLTTEPDAAPNPRVHLVPEEVSATAVRTLGTLVSSSGDSPIAFAGRMLQVSHRRAPIAAPRGVPDVRIPARSAVTLVRVFQQTDFKKPIFGVAVHLKGAAVCSGLPVVVSAYIEARIPTEWGGAVIDPRMVRALQSIPSMVNRSLTVVTHDQLRDLIYTPAGAPQPDALPERDESTLPPPPPVEQHSGQIRTPSILDVVARVAGSIHDLISPMYIPLGEPVIKQGTECDPDNLPDKLPEGMVCQLTGKTEWRFVPGRVLNAKKGDLVLSHDGHGLIGQMLQQLTPPQYYSHSGIMTKNHIELRHSTASEEWLLDHQKAGSGFDPVALKYLWPGTITQSIDQAGYYQWLDSPDTGSYQIHGFSFDPDMGSATTIVRPLVVKPPPFEETAQVRLTLHGIANTALALKGHYRFYCYTDPSVALDPAYVAGGDAGWAKGTVPTVCSSTIWLAAQHADERLEGANPYTSVGDLEPSDVNGGAEVDTDTRDGLYRYTAAERQAAGRWLYQTVYDQVYAKAGWLGRLLTDAPDNYANQICNTFASDWADGGSKDSDAWKGTGPANAVSPDDTMFWDSPGPGNENDFSSVYGHAEELFYRPGTFQQVPIWHWNLVPTRGTLTGTVVANGDVAGANVSLQGSGKPDVVVGSNGRFEFDNVPAGDYSVSAGKDIDHYWNSADDVRVSIVAGKTTDVTVALQPPPEVNRWVTVSVDMETDWTSVWAHSPHAWNETKSARVHPFHSHEHLEFGGGDTPRGEMLVDIDMNADLSVTISCKLQEIDDEVEGENDGGFDVPAGWWHTRSGISVSNGDPIDNDQTICNITVNNDQASA